VPGRLWLPSLLVSDVLAAEEGRHRPGTGRLWAESWYFDFAAADGSLGGYARLALYPNIGQAWYWAALVGTGRRLVMVKDHDLEAPRGRDLEVRGQGIWSAINCETPLDHWSVGLEAFALALDDPLEALRSERGDLIGLGYDLEWEATTPARRLADGYSQECRVSGEILVGEEKLEFDGPGRRDHRWGTQDWWAATAGEALPDALALAPLLLVGPDGRRAQLIRALTPAGWSQWVVRI
jgi:hypothetical protein